jgi:hypothetical protein
VCDSTGTPTLRLRCIVAESRETEIDDLVRKGLLKEDARNDVHAVRQALLRPPRSLFALIAKQSNICCKKMKGFGCLY